MSARLVAAICLFVSFSAVVPAAAAAVEPTATWSGKVKDRSLLERAPSSGFIADVKIWEKLWKAWRPEEPVPKVDFAKELIIVATVLGPNRVIMVPGIDDEGNLVFAAGGTQMFGPGFGYPLPNLLTAIQTNHRRHRWQPKSVEKTVEFSSLRRARKRSSISPVNLESTKGPSGERHRRGPKR